MDSIIRGTTPTINVTIPGLNEINPNEVWFSFKSGEAVYTFTKSMDDSGILIVEETISKTLTQEQTLNFTPGILYMQVRLLDDLNMAFATPWLTFMVEDVIQGGVIDPVAVSDEMPAIDLITTVDEMYKEFSIIKEDQGSLAMSISKEIEGISVSPTDAISCMVPSLLVTIEPSQSGSGTPSSSNVRPLIGHNSCTIAINNGSGEPTVVSASFGETIYGGIVDFINGTVTVTQGYYSPYAGETLTEPWLSDRDEFAPGRIPTAGAMVCYTLENPRIINIAKNSIRINSDTTISTEDGVITLFYATNVREKIENIDRIPNPPSQDGDYTLHAEVSNGEVVYSWE